MDIDEHEWADKDREVERLADGRFPVVFAFRPTKFLTVAPDKLRDWEELFEKNVGTLPSREAAYRWSGDPKETISGSNNDWDDCDYW